MSKLISRMTKADAMPPIVGLEAFVVAGRTYQAYKRGKWDEARERFIEESMGSIVWLCGVASMNALGDKLVSKLLKSQGKNFDVGKDKLRTPFQNFMQKIKPKGFSTRDVALIKGTKVLASVIITNLFIGFVVPKLNQALTRKLRQERNIENKNHKKNQQPVFKGAGESLIKGINLFTYAIENTNTGKLLSSDAGIAGGRMYNARSKEERREIAIRDIGSIYFYMWAQGHVRNLLNLIETGKATRLNPTTAKIFSEHLNEYLNKNNKEVSLEEFKKAVLGNPNDKINLPKNIKFETEKLSSISKFLNKKPMEVIKVSEAEKYFSDKNILSRIKDMSNLQPKRCGEAVLTKQQLIDALNISEINNPKLLDKVFTDYTGGNNKDEFKYVSNNKLYKLKQEMINYVESICKTSKNGKISNKTIEKALNKNIMYSGINFVAGFAVAAAFLSTIIPKIQYYVTRKTTGVDAFPGTYDYKNHRERQD